MTEDLKKILSADRDGLMTYEYIVNNIGICHDLMPELTESLIKNDTTGRYLVSAVRYLHATNPELYADTVRIMTAAAIDRDRERRYISDLLSDLYGSDYMDRKDELSESDDNFRRIFKRLYPKGF